jgi:transcriptional regulator with XRE-family HTH domain
MSSVIPAKEIKPMRAALGKAVRRLRKDRRLTIETLAFAAKMHPTYLSGIERGRRNPTFLKLCGIADALGIPVAMIAEEAEAEAQLATRMREVRSELGLPDP